ncbi:GAF domain-containing protein [Pseudonocardia kujensis]|uniref:sigma-54-dependent Fis family transcriptional regulator n=1 Tax=Pseudonocardia kujensis TaxID=1128675 RepID=UPI001E2DF509|nr:helix-turn-helix domain-containing protein [Pseudonocardia kujensis]MCE0762899.1 GAF domain-containing protein [Pseudonocardia kujensis]
MIDRDRERLLAGEVERIARRPEIVASWRRSRLSGVDPDQLELPQAQPEESRFSRTATPVLEAAADTLVGADTSLMLTGPGGTVLWRWTDTDGLRRRLDRRSVVVGTQWAEEHVGTNGIGTALETARPVVVTGADHYAAALHGFSCAAAPVRHPMTRRVLGALNMTCRAEDANPLVRPTLLKLVREIEAELYGTSSARERELFRHYLSARRRSSAAVVVLDGDILIANRAGARLELDHRAWWARAQDELAGATEVTVPAGPDGPEVRCRTVTSAGRTVGLIVTVPDATDGPALPAGPASPASGDGLADTVRRRLGVEPLLVHGEPGTGKTTLLTGLGLALHDAARVPTTGLPAWLDGVRSGLRARSGVALTHLQTLDEAACAALGALLDDSPAPRVAGTWSGDPTAATPAQQALLDRFGLDAVVVPPLRSRAAEIPALLDGLLDALTVDRRAPRPRLTPAATELLRRHPWPGNLRQLAGVARWLARQDRAVVDADDLPTRLRAETPRTRLTPMEAAEADAIRDALRDCGGNKVAAAARLQIARSSLYRKLREYGI